MIINFRLKYCREELELTQRKLAQVFLVHETTVSGWENGFDTMPFLKLGKFCNLYNYSLDYLLGLSEQKRLKQELVLEKNIIKKRLKALRHSLNLTQTQMAEILEISQPRYCNYENGKVLIGTLTLYTIAKKFKISLDKFLAIKEK